MKEQIEKFLKQNPITMSKRISSSGLFSSNELWDRRKVGTLQELDKLTREGFCVDDNLGVWLFNMFMTF
jgi:hypothetical protein